MRKVCERVSLFQPDTSGVATIQCEKAVQQGQIVVTDGMGTVHAQKTVYDLPFKNGFNMSLVDLNGDRVMEIAVAPGAGIAGLVQRFDHNLTLLDSFFALDSSYTGGVWLK